MVELSGFLDKIPEFINNTNSIPYFMFIVILVILGIAFYMEYKRIPKHDKTHWV